MKIQINDNIVKKRIERAAIDLGFILGIRFTQAITDPVYQWPRGDSPRDIVDTGELRNSQRQDPPVFGAKSVTFRYAWTAPHAIAVHNGARFRNGTELPARPWTQRALKGWDTNDALRRLL
jgi:hypothetical protein